MFRFFETLSSKSYFLVISAPMHHRRLEPFDGSTTFIQESRITLNPIKGWKTDPFWRHFLSYIILYPTLSMFSMKLRKTKSICTNRIPVGRRGWHPLSYKPQKNECRIDFPSSYASVSLLSPHPGFRPWNLSGQIKGAPLALLYHRFVLKWTAGFKIL